MFLKWLSRAFYVSIVVLAATLSHSKTDSREPANLSTDPYREFNFEKLKQLLRTHSISKIEDLIPHIERNYPGYLRHHVFVYDSLSLHGSSYQAPRALVYGNSGNFIITFNGEKSQKGCDLLETMEYDPKTYEFNFREVVFKGDSTHEHEADEVELDTANYSISKNNPQKCVGCHGTPIRPIWEPYFTWPGVYGSDDDKLHTFSGISVTRAYQLADPTEDHERNAWESFQKNAGVRYRPLLDAAPERSLDSYRPALRLTERLYNMAHVRLLRGLEERLREMGLTKAFMKLKACKLSNVPAEEAYPSIFTRSQLSKMRDYKNYDSVFNRMATARFESVLERHVQFAKGRIENLKLPKSLHPLDESIVPKINPDPKLPPVLLQTMARDRIYDIDPSAEVRFIAYMKPFFDYIKFNLNEYSFTLRRSPEFNDGDETLETILFPLAKGEGRPFNPFREIYLCPIENFGAEYIKKQ